MAHQAFSPAGGDQDIRPAFNPMPELRSEHRFAPRVQVLSPAGEYIYSAHREEAARLVRDGGAVPQKKGGRVRAIALVESLADLRTGPAHQPTARDYAGQSYVVREGIAHRFRHIDSRDEPLFRMAVIDCLATETGAIRSGK
ncbi:MAG TPA: hypothetical protein VN442_24230 [Bryobacteraceae bacterium]|nr:hypothetical protein [Bryobacteraceae bacterium]